MNCANLRTIGLATTIFLAVSYTGCNSESRQRPYPNREITIVVPFGAGGGTDSFARVMKRTIDKNDLLSEPVIIKNMKGAGATIGSRYVKDAKPDGYTVLLLHDAILTAKASGAVHYGAESFELVAGTAEFGMIIAVADNDGAPRFDSLGDLMETARRQPKTVKFGANLGALTHYAGAELAQKTPGAEFLFVQSGGGADRFNQLIGGHIDVSGFSIEEFNRYRGEGLKVLAYLGQQPHGSAPDVPTARQQGFEVVYDNMFYWWVPKGTPQDRIDVLAEVLRKAIDTPTMRKELEKIHCERTFLLGPQARQRIEASAKQYEQVEIRPIVGLPNIPLLVGLATTGMFAVVMVQSLRARSRFRNAKGTQSDAESNTGSRRLLAVGTVTLSALYVGLMAAGWLSFSVATACYIIIVGMMLTRWNWKNLVTLIVVGVGVGFGVGNLLSELLDVHIR